MDATPERMSIMGSCNRRCRSPVATERRLVVPCGFLRCVVDKIAVVCRLARKRGPQLNVRLRSVRLINNSFLLYFLFYLFYLNIIRTIFHVFMIGHRAASAMR